MKTAVRNHEMLMPMSVIGPNEDDELLVIFQFSAGSSQFIPPYNQPELYDPGSPDEFFILRAAHMVGQKPYPLRLTETEDEAITNYLDENWERE
jgi:hypothetical protein